MAVQTVSFNTYTDAKLVHRHIDLGHPHADKRFDRVWLVTGGVWHQQFAVPVLNYTVYRGFAPPSGSASGSIEASTEQWDSDQGWVFYMDRNCWGRLIDLDFEFDKTLLRDSSFIRPPIAIDYEILREL